MHPAWLDSDSDDDGTPDGVDSDPNYPNVQDDDDVVEGLENTGDDGEPDFTEGDADPAPKVGLAPCHGSSVSSSSGNNSHASRSGQLAVQHERRAEVHSALVSDSNHQLRLPDLLLPGRLGGALLPLVTMMAT